MTTQTSVFETMFDPSQKVVLTRAVFLTHIFPPFVCQYLMGVLAQLEGTRFYRLAFLPVLLWFAWRAVFVDMSGGDPKRAQSNTTIMTHMCSISMRAAAWAFARERFRRQNPSKQQYEDSESIYTVFWNTWDLMFNLRGVGWNWPRGVVLPKPFVETDSRTIFVLSLIPQLALGTFAYDACLQTIRVLSPKTFGSLAGGTLFDHTLPPLLELLRAVFISFLTVWMAYLALQWSYQFLAIVFVVLFQQRPSQWPPLFDAPWMSTSLSELWGRRWHQLLRYQFVNMGMVPFSLLFGRLGGLFGAFLVSGLFHDVELRSFGRGGSTFITLGFWTMIALGVVLERVWKAATGRRVGGVVGWLWTFGWLALWGVATVDEWAKTGRFGALSLPGGVEPARGLVEVVRSYVVV